METSLQEKIIEIVKELKTRKLIDPRRNIIASEKVPFGFKASVFSSNTISYNPKLSGFDDDMIRFALLHEEGHLKRGQYGIPALFFLLCLGFIPLLYCINQKVDPSIMIISTFFMLFIVVSSIRILTEPFHWDEYGSDEFASKLLRDEYGIKKPSEIVKNTLNAVPISFDSSSLFHRLCLAFIEYHPSTEQRVRNVTELVDEK